MYSVYISVLIYKLTELEENGYVELKKGLAQTILSNLNIFY